MPGSLFFFFCLGSEPGRGAPGALFFVCLESGPVFCLVSGQVVGPGALFFFAWYLSEVGVGQVLSFFCLVTEPGRSVPSACFFFFAWYLTPGTWCSSCR